MSASTPPNGIEGHRGKRGARRIVQWTVLFALWIGLSGLLDREFLVIGALSGIGAIALSERFFQGTHEGKFSTAPARAGWYLGVVFRFALYVPWLAYQIFVSNLHVIYLVLHPRMPIDPTLVEFDTTLTSELAQVTLAQSITLTPGTVTVDASDGKLLIHCLSRTTRQGIEDATIQTRVAKVFGEPWTEKAELTDITEPGQVPL